MSLNLPPRYVGLPPNEVYDQNLTDAHFRTLCQIRGLAWMTKGERTPALTIRDLEVIRGLTRANIFKHLAALRSRGYIRVEPLGDHQFVIYPLRWEPGSTVPTGDEAGFTSNEWEMLFGDDTSLKNETDRLKFETQHVVVDSDSDSVEEEQQQHDSSLKFETELARSGPGEGVLAELVAVLVENGAAGDQAKQLAADLFANAGAEVCRRQLDAFARRCELARNSSRGLANPAGLLIKSIQNDWPLPNSQAKKRRWYTDEEFQTYFGVRQ